MDPNASDFWGIKVVDEAVPWSFGFLVWQGLLGIMFFGYLIQIPACSLFGCVVGLYTFLVLRILGDFCHVFSFSIFGTIFVKPS